MIWSMKHWNQCHQKTRLTLQFLFCLWWACDNVLAQGGLPVCLFKKWQHLTLQAGLFTLLWAFVFFCLQAELNGDRLSEESAAGDFWEAFLKRPGPLEWCKQNWSETGLLLVIVLFLFNYRSALNRFHRCCKCLSLLFESSTALRQLSPQQQKFHV